jgi:hypothetical protein
MAKFFDSISEKHREFIEEQHMFFVATAPLSEDGHVNLSPKGLDSFRVLSPNRVAYLDMTGSGNETSAHLAENGRITFMFCAFKGEANIMRLYGTGRTILPDTPEWDDMLPLFTLYLGVRQIIVADIDLVQTSCGYAVPFMDFKADRQTLEKYWVNKGEAAIPKYWRDRNQQSIDGLPTPICAIVEQNEQRMAETS